MKVQLQVEMEEKLARGKTLVVAIATWRKLLVAKETLVATKTHAKATLVQSRVIQEVHARIKAHAKTMLAKYLVVAMIFARAKTPVKTFQAALDSAGEVVTIKMIAMVVELTRTKTVAVIARILAI